MKIIISAPTPLAFRAFTFSGFIAKAQDSCEIIIVSRLKIKQQVLDDMGLNKVKIYDYATLNEPQKGLAAKVTSWTMKVHQTKWNLFITKHLQLQNFYHKNEKRPKPAYGLRYVFNSSVRKFFSSSNLSINFLRKLERILFVLSYKKARIACEELLRVEKPDLVLATIPSVDQTHMFLRVAKKMGFKCEYYVLSHDNITSKYSFPVQFDKVYVWNERNKSEILSQYNTYSPSQIKLVGPLSFDWYNIKQNIVSRGDWIESLNLKGTGKIILFGTGVKRSAPGEPAILKWLCECRERGKLPKDLEVVVRLHPHDQMSRWKNIVDSFNGVTFQRSMSEKSESGEFIAVQEDISSLCSSLAHADLVITTFTSLALDGLRNNKPSIFLGFDPVEGSVADEIAKTLHLREHIYPQVEFNAVNLASSFADLRMLILKNLSNSNWNLSERKRLINTYDPFQDGKAYLRLLEFLK